MKKVISLALLLASVYSMQAFLGDIANAVDQNVVAPIGRTLSGNEASARVQRTNRWDASTQDTVNNAYDNTRMNDRVNADNLSGRIENILR